MSRTLPEDFIIDTQNVAKGALRDYLHEIEVRLPYDSVAALEAATVAGAGTDVTAVILCGRLKQGDCGELQLLVYSATDPGHAMSFQSADGAYWTLPATQFNVEWTGALGGIDFDTPTAFDANATANDTAFDAAWLVCAATGAALSGAARGYTVNAVQQPRGTAWVGRVWQNDNSDKAPHTTIRGRTAYTSTPTWEVNERTGSTNQWGARVERLHITRDDDAAGSIGFRVQHGVRVHLQDIRVVNHEWGFDVDMTWDSVAIALFSGNATNGARFGGTGDVNQSNMIQVLNLTLESWTVSGLTLKAASTTNTNNNLTFLYAKVEGLPESSATHALLCENTDRALFIGSHFSIKPGSTAPGTFKMIIFRRARNIRFFGTTLRDNNAGIDFESMFAFRGENNEDIWGVFSGGFGSGDPAGSLTVAMIDWGDQGNGDEAPVRCYFDVNGLVDSGSSALMAGTYSNWPDSNVVRSGGAVYTAEPIKVSPLRGNDRSFRQISRNGHTTFEFGPAETGGAAGPVGFFYNNSVVSQIASNGVWQIYNLQIRKIRHLDENVFTRAQLANNTANADGVVPNPENYAQGEVWVSDGAGNRFKAYSNGLPPGSGGAWYYGDGTLVTA